MMWRWWNFPMGYSCASLPLIKFRLFEILCASELADELVEWVPDDRC